MKTIFLISISCLLMVASQSNSASAQDENKNSADDQELESTFLNIPIKTFGGKQLWSDMLHFHNYRIQKNVVTNHFRLLDPNDVRLAWGGLKGCRNELQKIAREKNLKPVNGKVLIIMHGLTRTRGAMSTLANHIASNSDIQVVNVSYASTRESIASHAEFLASIIDNLPDVDEFHFMGHSMGNIVVRFYLAKYKPDGDSRFKRMVMIAPPNNGSRLAKLLQNNFLFKTFWGISGQDLSANWDRIEQSLATPNFEFGIIAGGQPDESALNNPLISGKNDLVVTVDETRLAGATDFMQEHLLHSTMMHDESVLKASLSFLQNGYFKSADQRQPITQ